LVRIHFLKIITEFLNIISRRITSLNFKSNALEKVNFKNLIFILT
jgi:hypothetical protein